MFKPFVLERSVASEDELEGILGAINKEIFSEPQSFAGLDPEGLPLVPQARQIAELPAQQRSDERSRQLNRTILETGFPGVIRGEDRRQPYSPTI